MWFFWSCFVRFWCWVYVNFFKNKTKQELGELLLSFFLCPGNSLNNTENFLLLHVFIICVKLSKSSAFLGNNSLTPFKMFSRLIGLCRLSSYSVGLGPFKFVNKDSIKIFRFSCVEHYPFSSVTLCVCAFPLFWVVFPELVYFISLFKALKSKFTLLPFYDFLLVFVISLIFFHFL